MKTIIEGFAILFVMGFIAYSSIGWINMNRQTALARSFCESAINQFENSDFDEGVMAGWQEKANEYGYVLRVVDKSRTIIDKTRPCFYVSLEYSSTNPFFGINDRCFIKEFAK